MKSLFPVFLFFCFSGFAQSSQKVQDDPSEFTVVINPKTFGYVNGIRLDSLDAIYGEFSRYSGESLVFDFGQKRDRRRDMLVTDSRGKRLLFLPFTNSIFLNFFYYNGWQLDKAVPTLEGGTSSFILRKKE